MKYINWIYGIAFTAFVIDWLMVGVKIYDGDYDYLPEAYFALVCLIVILFCAFCKILHQRCPHCGKLRLSSGPFCSHCGKKIEKSSV